MALVVELRRSDRRSNGAGRRGSPGSTGVLAVPKKGKGIPNVTLNKPFRMRVELAAPRENGRALPRCFKSELLLSSAAQKSPLPQGEGDPKTDPAMAGRMSTGTPLNLARSSVSICTTCASAFGVGPIECFSRVADRVARRLDHWLKAKRDMLRSSLRRRVNAQKTCLGGGAHWRSDCNKKG